MRKFLALTLTVLIAASLTADASAQKKKKSQLKPIKAAAVKLGRPVDFQKDVLPILEANCQACHNEAIDESKLVLEDIKSIMKGGKRGSAIVPKQPDKSLLYLVASHSKAPVMPPPKNKVDARALTPKELGILRQWILEGAVGGSGKVQQIAWAPIPATLNGIYSVAVSPWARYAAAGRANQITIYDIVSGREVGKLFDPALAKILYQGKTMYPGGAAHRDFVHSLAFSQDGQWLASGGYRTVKLWQRTPGVKTYSLATGGAVTALAVSADQKLGAAGSADNSIQLFDPKTGKAGKKLTGHSGAVTGLEFSADGKKLVSSSADKTIRVWDVAAGKAVRTITTPAAVNDVTFNKDASRIVSAHADNLGRVWSTVVDPKKKDSANKPLVELKGHSKPVTSVAVVLPAGTMVVTGSQDGTMRSWTISNGRPSRTMSHGAPRRCGRGSTGRSSRRFGRRERNRQGLSGQQRQNSWPTSKAACNRSTPSPARSSTS